MTETVPSKTVFFAELVPHGRTLCEFSIRLTNIVGALSEVASVLAKHHVNILSGYHDADANEWSFFADITQIDSTLENIVKEISGLSVVSQVILGEKVSEGLIADTLHKMVKWHSIRFIIARVDFVRSLLQNVKAIIGPEGKAAKVMIYTMGVAAGKQAYHQAAAYGVEYLRSHIQTLLDAYMAQGIGEFKLLSLDVEFAKALVRVSDSFECSSISGSSSSQSDLVRGYLAGFFSEYFGRRVEATETSCVALGHPYCHFEIAPSIAPE